ncbi:related to ThiJ/PfpI family protein [Cephalotrichum gorgonifer]|uniref:Related to ThiJ/PfpI family protein n=1 Tax=Cephalotrichum gorgonifer TaxID=2041049 RepID=A0AAE8N5P6_9PEZI|nr:related to ThiJ/PfpI family protein [Cephalotrichum gorgonifer]
MASQSSLPPQNYGVALFEGFQALDVFGPVDVLNLLSATRTLKLSLIAPTLDPVTTVPAARPTMIGQRIVPTHTYETAPDDLEVLLVPGGFGTRDLERTQPVVDFIKARYPKLRFLLTVCTGSALAARAGVLDGKEATSNKASFEWVASQRAWVKWQREARWVVDGNIWTSSGISAGIDQIFAFIEAQYGEDVAEALAKQSEYVRNKDPKNDPFKALAG